jgi:hypothetical protein
VYPADDIRFAAAARHSVASGGTTPAFLAADLRANYPNVVVRARDLAGEQLPMWYVYRDGRWKPSSLMSDGSAFVAGRIRTT